MGDINFPNASWTQMVSSDDDEAVLVEFVQDYRQLIKGNRNQLDFLLTNNSDFQLNISADNRLKQPPHSDHPLYLLKLSDLNWILRSRATKIFSPLDFNIFPYSKAAWTSLGKHIEHNTFLPYCFSSVEVVLQLWYEWVQDCFELHFSKATKHWMSLAPWVKPQTSNLLKRRNTPLRLISRKSILSRLEKLKKIIWATIQDSMAADKMEYKTDVFCIGRFFEKQKYLKVLKNSTNYYQLRKAELFNEYFQSVFNKCDYKQRCTTITDTNEFSTHFNCEENKLALESLQTQKIGPLLFNVYLNNLPTCIMS